MKLETVEKSLGLTYPRAFREIYESGALRWLCGNPQAKAHLFPNRLLQEDYNPQWNLLRFSEVERKQASLCLQVKLNRGRWKEGVHPLPFGEEYQGSIFFFDAALENPEAPVFCWSKDNGRVGLFSRSFEEFICMGLCEPVANGLISLDHWWIQNHMRYLTPEHRAPFLARDLKELDRMVSWMSCWEETDYISY